MGEIFLVMIGILPALQVNHWNQDRSNRRIEKKYLESLGNEYLVNEKNLDQSLMYMDSKMNELKILIDACGDKPKHIETTRLKELIGSALTFYDIALNQKHLYLTTY